MANGTPYEVIMGPMELYVAPVGEAFPDVDEAPAGASGTSSARPASRTTRRTA